MFDNIVMYCIIYNSSLFPPLYGDGMKKAVFIVIMALAGVGCEKAYVGDSITPVKQSVVVGTYLPPADKEGK